MIKSLKFRNIVQSSFFLDIIMKINPEIKRLKKNIPEMPEIVNAMTVTRCNYKCGFCPNSTITHPRGKMSIEMYNKILDQLGKNWDGVFCPQLQNEPFLDKRLPELVKLAREKLPKCTIEIQTNGSLLNKELIEKILPYTDTLKVNDYTDDFKVIRRIKKYGIKNNRLVLVRRYPNDESLTNVANNVKYKMMKRKILPLNKFCAYPFKTAAINYDGKLLICCMDWKHEHEFGDLNKSSLKEIWNNEKFKRLRESLSKSVRNYPLCQKCDFDGYSVGDFRRKHKSLYQFIENSIFSRNL